MCFVVAAEVILSAPVSVRLFSGVPTLFVLSLFSGVIFMWLGGVFFAIFDGSVGRALGCWGGGLDSLVMGVGVWFSVLRVTSFLGWVSLVVSPCCMGLQAVWLSTRLRFPKFRFLTILQ